MAGRKVIGVDFGTLSARAILASCDDGQILAEKEYVYPHGVISGSLPDGTALPPDFALADAGDYREALQSCIRGVVSAPGVNKEEIIGIGIAATTYTMVPCRADGTAVTENGAFSSEPHAFIKLWKHHGAIREAERIFKLHQQTGGFPAIENYGKVCNCEWALPKLLETYEKAPEVFRETYRFCDLGEWLTWMLTGRPVTSLYSAGFKGMWTPKAGYPSREILDRLSEGFGDAFYRTFTGEIADYRSACGTVSREAAEVFGLPEGIAVASPMGDGSTPGIYYCIQHPDAIAITLGTSTAMAFVKDTLIPVTGINGVVNDGIVPGYASYDAGLPCSGDMLGWFIENQIPERYSKAAKDAGCGIYDYLTRKAEAAGPWNNALTVLDWFNGNRSILNDPSLRGSIFGYSLATKPEDIYCAMVLGMACATRKVTDHLAKNGLAYEKLIFCGGIAEKNAFIMQQYANILKRPLYISAQHHITALSAAVYACHAAGIPLQEAAENMTVQRFSVVEPETEHAAEYETIYRRWCFYHDLMSENRFDSNE